MDNTKNDNYYIQKIKQDLEFIVIHMHNVDAKELNKNEILLDSMLFRMIQISENAKKLSDVYKQENGHIPWNSLYGLRNRIVHDYGNVDLNIVYETLKNDIPELIEMLVADLLLFVHKLMFLSVIIRRYLFIFFKNTGEVFFVAISNQTGNVCDRFACLNQIFLCVCKAHGFNVLYDNHMKKSFKCP